MGVILERVVVIGSKRRNWPKAVQPGNREWATVIQGINACGWAILLFIVLAGMYYLSIWYKGNNIL